MRVALIAIDPTRSRSGGALLADRLRMNSGCHPRVYLRSMATRRRHLATSAVLRPCLEFLRTLGFDLVLIETAGTGQGDTEIVDLVDVAVYVMTADYGGPSQLEKIQMLDAADAVVLNKRDKPGAADALRAVQDHLRTVSREGSAVFDTSAHRFDDPGLERLFLALCERLSALGGAHRWTPAVRGRAPSKAPVSLLPQGRLQYLSEIARQGREEREAIERKAQAARRAQAYYLSCEALDAPDLPAPLADFGAATADPDPVRARLREGYQTALVEIGEEGRELLRAWPEQAARYRAARLVYRVRDRDQDLANDTESQSGVPIPAVALPMFEDWGTLCCASSSRRTCPAATPIRPASTRAGTWRPRRACSRARVVRSVPTAVSTTSRAGPRPLACPAPRACRRPSIRSSFTAQTRTLAPMSTAVSGCRGCRWPRSMT